MNMWDPVAFSATPAAQIVARCVAAGVVSQEDVDRVPREACVFSPLLINTERLVAMETETLEKNLQLELLELEKKTADITHSYHLSQKFTALQGFTSHLQEVLREQVSLRQRLMKPLCQQTLPVEANLHRHVVGLLDLAVDMINNLESKIKAARLIPTIDESMTTLNNSLTQLLTQVAEVEELSTQVLQRKEHQRIIMIANDNAISS